MALQPVSLKPFQQRRSSFQWPLKLLEPSNTPLLLLVSPESVRTGTLARLACQEGERPIQESLDKTLSMKLFYWILIGGPTEVHRMRPFHTGPSAVLDSNPTIVQLNLPFEFQNSTSRLRPKKSFSRRLSASRIKLDSVFKNSKKQHLKIKMN